MGLLAGANRLEPSFIAPLRGRLHGAFSTPGLNSALLTGLKFFTITWKISTPGLKYYTFPPLEVTKKWEILKEAAENMKRIAMLFFLAEAGLKFQPWG